MDWDYCLGRGRIILREYCLISSLSRLGFLVQSPMDFSAITYASMILSVIAPACCLFQRNLKRKLPRVPHVLANVFLESSSLSFSLRYLFTP